MYLAHYTKRFIPEFDAECRVYAAAKLECYFSDSENDALAWLAALGCSLDKE